jgi:hypothetical protein
MMVVWQLDTVSEKFGTVVGGESATVGEAGGRATSVWSGWFSSNPDEEEASLDVSNTTSKSFRSSFIHTLSRSTIEIGVEKGWVRGHGTASYSRLLKLS